MVLHTRLQVREVECDTFAVDGDGHLDVPHQVSRFLFHPSSDLHHHGIKSCLGIGVKSVYVSGETDTHASCQLF